MMMMMASTSREGYHEAKQEGSDINNNGNNNKYSSKVIIPSSSSATTTSSSSSRQWSAFRNPRIVRVSRSFGGKDRHSKVCTIRGLRDRRIRLSVPTAIQLYDLQDKLGLNQPSKVIDWLLEATKFDIDKLPPLQFPATHGGLFSQFHHHQNSLLFPHHHDNANNNNINSSLGAFYDPANYYSTYQNLMIAAAKSSRFWDNNSNMDYCSMLSSSSSSSRVLKGKELAEKGKWIIKTNGQEEEKNNNNNNQDDEVSATITTQRLFPPLHGLLNNSMSSSSSSSSYGGSNYHNTNSSEHSNGLSLSQFGSHGLMLDPHPIISGNNGVHHQLAPSSSLQVPLSGGSQHHQLFFGPSYSASAVATTTPPSLFSPYAPFVTTSSSMDNTNDPVPRQFNHIQFLNSSSQVLPHYIPSLHHHSFNSPVRPFPPPLFSSKLLESDTNNNNIHSQSDNKGSTHS